MASRGSAVAQRRRRGRLRVLWIVLTAVALPLIISACAILGQDRAHWSRARWDSAGIAPDPAATSEAVVQVFAARAYGWRGIFGVHTWITIKLESAPSYTRFEVVGWAARNGGNAISVNRGAPDGFWAGSEPELLRELRGPAAAAAIAKIRAAIETYPYKNSYTLWPGPNSNTFVAWVGRHTPELSLDLPPTAIGKDFIPSGVIAAAPSGSGVQASLFGLLGVMAAFEEGVEINFLGLTFGVDVMNPAIKLPGIGRIGMPNRMYEPEPTDVPATILEEASLQSSAAAAVSRMPSARQ